MIGQVAMIRLRKALFWGSLRDKHRPRIQCAGDVPWLHQPLTRDREEGQVDLPGLGHALEGLEDRGVLDDGADHVRALGVSSR